MTVPASQGRPTLTQILDWLEGRLTHSAAARVASAVETGDAATLDDVRWAQEFLDARAVMPLIRPPTELSQRIRNAFSTYRLAQSDDGWIDGELRHDSRRFAGSSGMRSSSDGPSAQLTYATAIGSVILTIEEMKSGLLQIQGHIAMTPDSTGVTRTGADVVAVEQGTLRGATHAGRTGRFVFRDVPTTVDQLWLTSGTDHIRISLDLLNA